MSDSDETESAESSLDDNVVDVVVVVVVAEEDNSDASQTKSSRNEENLKLTWNDLKCNECEFYGCCVPWG